MHKVIGLFLFIILSVLSVFVSFALLKYGILPFFTNTAILKILNRVIKNKDAFSFLLSCVIMAIFLLLTGCLWQGALKITNIVLRRLFKFEFKLYSKLDRNEHNNSDKK